jgi:hypothetical protein
MKIDEYVPTIMPMNKASAMSRSVPTPKMKAPINKIAATGKTATTDVFIDLTSV